MVGIAKVLNSISECLFASGSDNVVSRFFLDRDCELVPSVLGLGVRRLACPRLVVDPHWNTIRGLMVVAF